MDQEIIECVRLADQNIAKQDQSALNDLCVETSFVASWNKLEWIAAIVSVTQEWPETIRPTADSVRKCCEFNTKTVIKDDPDAAPVAINAKALTQMYTQYRDPVIEGLLRKGETLNIIAGPKVGKSWLVLSLALSVSNGNPWLGMETEQSNVLIVDNELHKETLAMRIQGVAEHQCESMMRVSVLPLRGRNGNILTYRDLIVEQARKTESKIIILDALYRFLPPGVSENDNAGMTSVYNTIDAIAIEADCSILIIHHSSKGNQGDKSVTDGGAGAGAINRAADAVLFLRAHEEEDHVVLDAVNRSWKPMDSFVVKGNYIPGAKVWEEARHMDPSLVLGRKEEKPMVSNKPVTVEQLLKERLIPLSDTDYKVAMADACTTLNATKTNVEIAFKRAISEGLAEKVKIGRDWFIRKTRN